MVPVISRTVSRGIAAFAALAIALMAGLALTIPTQAFADEPALAVSTLADDDVKVINTKASYTWVKAGKKVYQWGRYNKRIANGTLYQREIVSGSYLPWNETKGVYATISNLKSANTNIIRPKAFQKYGYIKYVLRKAGTATITYSLSYADENGQAVIENVTETHKVIKYTRPIKSFKVGSKNYAAKFKTTPQVNAKSALKGKLTVKAAKGWTIKKIRKVNSAVTSGEFVSQNKLKNGSKVNISKSASSAIEVICYNKKGAYYSSVILTPNFTYGTIAG